MTGWIEMTKLLASDGTEFDKFGSSVSVDGDTALIGASCSTYNADDPGSVYVFSKYYLSLKLKDGFGVNAVITNNGTWDVNNVLWQIHVDGGILGFIEKSVSGEIDIPAGESIIIRTGILLGLGRFYITVNVAEDDYYASGLQLIIFSRVFEYLYVLLILFFSFKP